MFLLVAAVVFGARARPLLIEGIRPGETTIDSLTARFGKPTRANDPQKRSVLSWKLKGGLTLSVHHWGVGRAKPVASTVGVTAWNGTFSKALAKNGFRTQIPGFRALTHGMKDAALARELHQILGKVPRQRISYHTFSVSPPAEHRLVFFEFEWGLDNRLK
ncbi:hypothetical protein EON79_11010, partial [bacterium]